MKYDPSGHPSEAPVLAARPHSGMAEPKPKNTPILHLLTLLLLLAAVERAEGVGVNWGTASSHPLQPQKVVELLKTNRIAKVKLFDTDPLVLQSLSGSNIRVTVGIPNSMLRSLNSSLKAAESWVHDNLTRYVSDRTSRVLIDYVAVGDEPFLLSYGDQFHPFIIGAATNIQAALYKANLDETVKVVVPCSFDAFLSESGLPSNAQLRPDINTTMIKLLTFLNKHRAPFFVTISPFQTYHENKNISLDFGLFRETAQPRNDSHKSYKNIFDLSYDSVTSALSGAGFREMDVVVNRIGWPTDGAPNATVHLAQEFNKGLINHLSSRSGKPEVYISSLLDEDKRSISVGTFERHWGVFTFDGQAKYDFNLGQGLRKLANAQDVQYLSSKWCVVNNNKGLSNATAVALNACASADCSALAPGGSCSNLSSPRNVSYAFNSYYQQHDQDVGSCDFAGLGLITTVDPSADSCRFIVGIKTSAALSLQQSAFSRWSISLLAAVFIWLFSCKTAFL